MSLSSKSDNPLHQALLQSGKLFALAHYCNTIAQFEQDKDAAQLFSAIQAETLQHSQGHLDFLRQHSSLIPSSSTAPFSPPMFSACSLRILSPLLSTL